LPKVGAASGERRGTPKHPPGVRLADLRPASQKRYAVPVTGAGTESPQDDVPVLCPVCKKTIKPRYSPQGDQLAGHLAKAHLKVNRGGKLFPITAEEYGHLFRLRARRGLVQCRECKRMVAIEDFRRHEQEETHLKAKLTVDPRL
jgi:hypothetical protein